jgi:ribosome-associated translation inhibitor RaiA
VERGAQKAVKLSGNGNVNSGTNVNPISANQLQNTSATLMAAMQTANAKLASTLEKHERKVSNRQPLRKKDD